MQARKLDLITTSASEDCIRYGAFYLLLAALRFLMKRFATVAETPLERQAARLSLIK